MIKTKTTTLRERIARKPDSIINALSTERAAIIIPNAKVFPNGLQLESGTSYDRWEQLGTFWNQLRVSKQWWVGDWCNFGEATYGDRYSQAIDETGYDYSTIANMAWVAGKVEFSRRRENLSFEHHKEVAKLKPEDQVKWLEISETEGLTREELRKSIKSGVVVRITADDEKSKNEVIDGIPTIAGLVACAERVMNELQPIEEWGPRQIQLVYKELKPLESFIKKVADAYAATESVEVSS